MSYWSEEQEALRATGRTFVEREVLPHLADWEAAQELPRELHARAAKQGLLGVSFPEDVGGEGGGLLESVALTEAMMEAGASGGLIASLLTHGIALPHIVQSGNADLIDRFVRPTLAGDKIGSLAITEPGGGSDVAGIRTKAVRDPSTSSGRGGDFIVNGAKTFITSGVRADFVTTAVRTGGPGHHGISLLVVERGTPGFEVTRKLEKLGWHCSDTAELSYTDARVPADNLVGEEGSGFVQIAMAFVTERVGLAVQGYSTAQRCLALAVDYAKQRQTFGEPLVNRQVVRHKLVEMHRRIEAARVYTREVARRYDAGEQPLVEALHAKKLGVDAATYCVDEAVQLHGGTGYMRGTEVEMHYRDSRILGIGGGANEVLDDLAAKLLGYSAGSAGMTAVEEEVSERRTAMLAKLADLDAEHAKAVAGGGERYNERHKARGKLLARERIELLLDEGAPFLELMPLAGWGSDFTVGASIVTGIGVVSGVECMIVANDPTVKGGASNPWTLKKSFRAAQIAAENDLPTINLVESGGADLPTQKEIFIPGGKIFRDITRSSADGRPTIALVFGNSTAGGAYIPGMSDYVVMVKEGAKVFLGGPPLVKMATGEESDDESLGGAEMHAKVSGLADYLAVDEVDAIRIGRRIVARLNRDRPKPGAPAGTAPVAEPDLDAEDLLDLIPTDLKEPFDPREVILRLVDGVSAANEVAFDEFKPLYGSSLVTGWARLHGHQIGILANAQGILFSEEAQKAAQFIQLANQIDVPLLFLHNTTGYMVGKDYEQGGIIKHGAMMINAVSNSRVPHLSVIMGASYGAGNYGMNGRAYDPRFLFTWPSAKSAVMGPAQLAGVLSIVARAAAEAKGKPYDDDADAGMRAFVEAQVEEQSLPFFLSGMVYDDGVIDPRETRTVLGICLSVIANKPIEGTDRFGVFRM